MSQPLVPPRGEPFQLKDYASNYTGDTKRDDAERELDEYRERLNDLQERLYAGKQFSLLVVLQAIDTGGKDGVIKSVFREVGPLRCSVANFGVPSEEERSHDYLWRYHQKCPPRGKTVIFNRSHYESVLVERVKGFAPEDVWKARYEEINRFEEYLVRHGTVIMKFFLHISKEEQRERLQDRVDTPRKQWKFRMGDLDDRKLWDDYQKAFEDMVAKCNTADAPWHVVPADRNWYRDWAVAKALVERLEKLNLQWPEPEVGVKGLKVV